MTAAIVRTELKILWASPLPYVLGALFHVTLGVLGWSQIVSRGQALFQPVVPVAGFLLLVVVPVLAARSLADERRQGTLELLLAVPVPAGRLVAGKYLALVATVWALLAPVAVFVVLLALWGDPDAGPVVAGFAGLALLSAATAALGLLASSLTASQPVAALGAMFAVLGLWFAHVGSDVPGSGGIVGALSFSERLRTFAGGAVVVSDVVFFGSVVAGGLVLATAAVARRR